MSDCGLTCSQSVGHPKLGPCQSCPDWRVTGRDQCRGRDAIFDLPSGGPPIMALWNKSAKHFLSANFPLPLPDLCPPPPILSFSFSILHNNHLFHCGIPSAVPLSSQPQLASTEYLTYTGLKLASAAFTKRITLILPDDPGRHCDLKSDRQHEDNNSTAIAPHLLPSHPFFQPEPTVQDQTSTSPSTRVHRIIATTATLPRRTGHPSPTTRSIHQVGCTRFFPDFIHPFAP